MDRLRNVILALTLASAYPAAAVDLTVTAISASPATVPLGSTVTIASTVAASGGNALNALYVQYYLSADSTITTSDVLLGSRYLSAGLKDGESSTATLTFSPPTNISGTYFVGVIVDSSGAVAESDETNNALAGNAIVITKPDLVVTSASGSPSTVPLGSTVTITSTVAASGGKTVNAFYVHYYLSTDQIITASDVSLGSRYLSAGLKDGESSTATLTFSPPTNISGTYFVGVIVDSNSAVAESVETNNALAGNAIVITKPDLVVTSASGSPSTVPLGSTVTITSTVAASGGKTVNAFYVHYYLSTDQIITASDVSLGSRYLSAGLKDGESSTATLTFSPPTNISGTYFVGVIVDSNGAVAESDETNNALAGNAIVITKPDLVVTSASGSPSTVPLGSTVTITSTVAASGGNTINPFYVHYYLSTDPTITTSDVSLGSRYLSAGLNDGESSTATLTFSPPTNISGTYYVGVIVDSSGAVAESDETNNALAGNAIVITKPDLVVTSASGSPSTVPLGSTVTITSTVAASGGKTVNPFYVHYYLSTDPTITTSDVPLGSRYLSAGLKDGESSTATMTFSPPTNISGTYYVGVIVDMTSQVSESDETNNALAGSVITITKPDLILASLSASATILSAGLPVTISDKVNLTGGSALSSFLVSYYLSPDSVITRSDTLIGSRSISSMQAGDSNSLTSTFNAPSVTGVFYLGAIADSTDTISESNELNNTFVWRAVQVGSDPSPPRIAVLGAADGQVTNELPLQVCYTVDDPDLATVEGTLDGIPFDGCAWAYMAGEHVVMVSTSDTFGNAASETVRFVIDVTEPGITIVSPQDGGFVGGVNVEVTVASSDEYGIAGVTVNGAALTVDAGGQFSGAASLPAEGINELAFVATDTAGNSRAARIQVVRDTLPPAITIDVPQDGAVVGTETMVSGIVTDAGPVVVTVSGAAVSLDGDGRFSQRIQIQPGQRQIVVTAVDGAGNVSSRSRSVSDGISTRYCYDGAGNMVGRINTAGADCGAL